MVIQSRMTRNLSLVVTVPEVIEKLLADLSILGACSMEHGID